MKPHVRNPLLLLITGLGLMLTGAAAAQTFTTLYNFTGGDIGRSMVENGVILSGNTLYGTTCGCGSPVYAGTVFKLNTDGTGFTNIYSFNGVSDGGDPNALILSGNTLYGTASGPRFTKGTVFRVNTDGTGFTNLHNFNGLSDGASPFGGLILSGNTLYGTTWVGGTSDYGTVFKVNTDGTGFTNLYSFTALSDPSQGTNSDGAKPIAGLVLSGNTLYGTASYGGSSGNGTVFAMNTNGTDFTNIHSFTTEATDTSIGSATNGDGAFPLAGLILSGNTLYGMAREGGSSGNGTVFKVNTDGTRFTTLYSFTAVIPGPRTNSDGAYPSSVLLLSSNTLYGTAGNGGSSGNGTVFRLHTDGTGFTTLHSFTAASFSSPYTNSDGLGPNAVILSGNTLYGTAGNGGSSGNGTVFSLSFPPQLTLIPSGQYVILTWPTDSAGLTYAGYTLQSTTNLSSLAVWAPVSPRPVVIGGQNVVINTISGTQQFYRLSQ